MKNTQYTNKHGHFKKIFFIRIQQKGSLGTTFPHQNRRSVGFHNICHFVFADYNLKLRVAEQTFFYF